MPSCSARGCSNRSGRGAKVTFHLFPKNNEARQKWVPATGRKNWSPGKRAVLCSEHFDEECFDRTGQTTRLRIGAVPTKGKFAPKIKKVNLIHIKQEPEDEQKPKQKPTNKLGITTRSGRQLSGRMAAVVAAMKRDPSEDEEVESLEPDDPPFLDAAADSHIESAPSTYPDHFYCRTQNEMEALLRKSEQKVEFLKMKLDYLNTPKKIMKQEPPDWTQFRRAALQKEAELIKVSLQAGSPALSNAEEIKKQIKVLQQKNRRLKKKSKAKFIRYVVMIEPTKAGKNATAACSLVRDEEEEDDESKEEGASATVEQISSIQESILSHTASMIMGPSGLQDEKDKQIQELQRKVKIARQKEKRKTEQLEHLQEVVEILKEKCSEYSVLKEPATQRRCSLCHSFLLKRCHQIAKSWTASDIAQEPTLPLGWTKPHPEIVQMASLGSLDSNKISFCSDCQALAKRNKLKQRSLVSRLNPQC
ncbi:THAP domain-containing protein 2 [Portunus trituberculatus]|uniref:THAP domain-containing protein 2 n=1 Tax=Portunus trituberculatus TaxID=210409 RepID=A0A5B7DB81_PORTR|nr:THAP domain-containing protein 2 [Portunus trituberculatus]